MSLRERIAAAEMSPAVARAFADALRAVAVADGGPHSSELVAIESLLDSIAPEDVEPAPLEALWPYRDLLLTSCIFLAVVDGGYGVEEARKISDFAHRLGLSAHMLSAIEDEVFGELKARAGR